MPLYDYECAGCDLRLEVTLRMGEVGAAVVDCPDCSIPMERVFTPPAIRIRDGTTPMRFSGGKRAKGTRKVNDPGFNKEYESIWEAAGMELPEPKEKDPEYEKRRAAGIDSQLEHARQLKKAGKGGLSGNLKRLKDEGKG